MRKKLRILAITSLAAWIAGTSFSSAFARADTRKMTCRQVQGLINKRGAVVLVTGRYTYDRYVRSQGFCSFREVTRIKHVKTRDNRACRVKRCEDASIYYPNNPLFDDDWRD